MTGIILCLLSMFHVPIGKDKEMLDYSYRNHSIDREYNKNDRIYKDTAYSGNKKIVFIHHEGPSYERGLCMVDDKIFLVDFSKPWDGVQVEVKRGQ